MRISDSVLKTFAGGHMGHGEVVATLPESPPVKGASTPERPWRVRTERELTVEERLAALVARLAAIEAQGQ
jgi:hypothetical protein